MRTGARGSRASTIVALALACVAAFACTKAASTDSDDGDLRDAGGGAEANARDALTADATDAGQTDVQPADASEEVGLPVVTIAVARGTGPAPALEVVFHDGAGEVIGTATTGPDGKAVSAPGLRPEMATVLLGRPGKRVALTWLGVALGDVLRAVDIDEPAGGTYRVEVADHSAAGAGYYYASVGGCAGPADSPPFGQLPSLSIAPSRECVSATSSILARARGGGGDVLGYAFLRGVGPPTSAGTVAKLSPWSPPSRTTVTVAPPPPTLLAFVDLYDIADGLATTRNETGTFFQDGGSTFKVATGFADAIQGTVRATMPGRSDARSMAARRGPPGAALAIDYAPALPLLDTATIDATLPHTPQRPHIAWTAASPTTSSDGGGVFMTWTDDRAEQLGWAFVVPPSTTSVTVPAMPPGAAAWLPRPTGASAPSTLAGPEVFFLESDVLAGYGAYRQEAAKLVPASFSEHRATNAILPVEGSLRVTSIRR